MSSPKIDPCFTLTIVSDDADRLAEELSFVIHGIRAAMESGDGDGALFVLMGIRDRMESLAEYAQSIGKAQNGEGGL